MARKRKIIHKATRAEKKRHKKQAAVAATVREMTDQRPRGPLRTLAYWAAVAAVWSFILGLLGFLYLAHDLPDLDNLPKPGVADQAIVVKAGNGTTLVRYGPVYGAFLPYAQIPDSMTQAIIAVEDRRFMTHNGFDGRGFLRALWQNIAAGRVRAGGSTLTQQLAKNMFLSSERTIRRKAQELLLAFWLETKFSKQDILTLYLNRIYFGGGAYGIDAAARKFFGHSANRLTIGEAAMLAGLVQAPSRLAPHINPDGAWKRGKLVLDSMARADMLTNDAAGHLKTRPPKVIIPAVGQDVRYFTDWIRSRISNTLGPSNRSLVIYTTLDPAAQTAAAGALSRGIMGEGQQRRASQGAVVALDHDGAVRAMVGGVHYRQSQYNRAALAQRQPGSAFKLFPYLAALEAGINPDDLYTDKPVQLDGWSPKNYDGNNHGSMTVAEAFARSINTVAVEISEKTGRSKVVAMAKRLGIKSRINPVASLPLGTEEVSVLDLASAYATVANGGHRAAPYGILEITDLDGQVLYRRPRPALRPVLTFETARTMTEMLTGVVRFGSGKNARIDRPVAGKTGTSQDNRDALFAGFSSDLTCVVWVGNDDDTPMRSVTGGGLPARIWADFMIEAHAGHPVRPLLADAGLYHDMQGGPEGQPGDSTPPVRKKKKKRSLWDRLFGS